MNYGDFCWTCGKPCCSEHDEPGEDWEDYEDDEEQHSGAIFSPSEVDPGPCFR